MRSATCALVRKAVCSMRFALPVQPALRSARNFPLWQSTRSHLSFAPMQAVPLKPLCLTRLPASLMPSKGAGSLTGSLSGLKLNPASGSRMYGGIKPPRFWKGKVGLGKPAGKKLKTHSGLKKRLKPKPSGKVFRMPAGGKFLFFLCWEKFNFSIHRKATPELWHPRGEIHRNAPKRPDPKAVREDGADDAPDRQKRCHLARAQAAQAARSPPHHAHDPGRCRLKGDLMHSSSISFEIGVPPAADCAAESAAAQCVAAAGASAPLAQPLRFSLLEYGGRVF
jgi:hypothetical protein